ncbi:MAG: 30S ribosomal protein S4 [Elusimicrobia bacterium]|nr:30S ribosomal protein S4 [Elusimicrobiota bacterium]
MARYIDSVCKLCRREQTKLFLKGDKCHTKCVFEKHSTTPGMAPPQRGKPSNYAIRLREKQKLRRLAMVNERPFERLVQEASKSVESSGTHLLGALEMRLDNVVRRMGVATSLKTARQLVLHGHIKVSGKRISIPSYRVKAGDVVALDPKLRENVGVKLSLETSKKLNGRPSFMQFNEEDLSAKILRQPDRSEMGFPVTDQLIIEYYSK